MTKCGNCGAPIQVALDAAVRCAYCGTMQAPPPKEVIVPVPVQVMYRTVVESEGSEARELRCPHCRKLLVTVRAADVDLNGCAGCGGIWLDNDSAGRIIAAPSRVFDDLANRAAIGMKFEHRINVPICAECPALLDRLTSRGIELDICSQHGTWFDAFELGRLTAVLRGEPDPKRANLSDRWTCDGCRTSIRTVDANLTDFGMICDRCWRDRQTELRAKSEQRIADTGSALGLAGALVGALFGAAAAPNS